MCLFPKKIYGFMGLLYIGLVSVFMGLFLGFIFCFSGFDGDFFWLLDLVASWIWEEHEENFLLVFNLIFSSCFHLYSSDMGLSSWLLGLCSFVLVI